jgi:anti-sigma B factor antagonist
MIEAMADNLELYPDAGAGIVTLTGELDAHDAPRLRELFASALEGLGRVDGRRVLVLDLSLVAFLDSTVLGTMIGALRRVRELGGDMRVVLPSSTARRIFEITGLDEVLDVYETTSAALDA